MSLRLSRWDWGQAYRRLAFPNEKEQYLEYLSMEGVSAKDREHWKRTFDLYIRYLNLHYGKRLTLKSPPHTGRIGLLKELYPNAKFIHITRDPQSFIPSTMHLWAALETATTQCKSPNWNGCARTSSQRMKSYTKDSSAMSIY